MTIRRSKIVAALGAAVLALLVLPGAAQASAPAGHPVDGTVRLSCAYDASSTVVDAAYLKVHVKPALSATAIGQIPRGHRVDFCSSSATDADGYTWFYGYGKNGSVTVKGWMVSKYLALP